eukprot:TRINITY_DN4043_c0_g2_i1.p1 TRINITY_DN4043_c0_g2~~TRINITY_DN4043_c0_g2_i1.p1  ORF type:complete len:210 (+),score=37.61 TRINITY_DN4043_c0_g2_i1:378-1007(+)
MDSAHEDAGRVVEEVKASAEEDAQRVVEEVRAILSRSNVEELTERRLRQLVKEATGVDTSLKEHKSAINRLVVEHLANLDSRLENNEEETARSEEVDARRAREAEEDDGEGNRQSRKQEVKRSAEIRLHSSSKRRRDENGDILICELSERRQLTVNQFKGRTFVSIREYYEKGGKLLPSSKGISLSVEQWKALCNGSNNVDAAITRLQG